jgi:hypothetical protein
MRFIAPTGGMNRISTRLPKINDVTAWFLDALRRGTGTVAILPRLYLP